MTTSTTPTANEVAALGTSFDMGGGLGGGGLGGGGLGGGGMGGGESMGFGGADVLPFTGISTVPLAIAGLVAAVVGSVMTRLGKDKTATVAID